LKEDVNTQVKALVESLWDDLKLLFFLKNQQNQNIVLSFRHNAPHKSPPQHMIYQGKSIFPIKTGVFKKEDDVSIAPLEFKFCTARKSWTVLERKKLSVSEENELLFLRC